VVWTKLWLRTPFIRGHVFTSLGNRFQTFRSKWWHLLPSHAGWYTGRKKSSFLTNVPVPQGPHSVFMCFVWISEQTAIIFLHSIKWLVFITETECVYCAVRTGSLYIILRSAHTVYLCVLCGSQNKQRLFPYTALTDWLL
jgi:hypothetical protein